MRRQRLSGRRREKTRQIERNKKEGNRCNNREGEKSRMILVREY